MDNNIKIFENSEFGKVRTIILDNEPWFVGNDVANILGYGNPRQGIASHVDDDDKGVQKLDTPSGKQNIAIINESGLYSLILSSKLPTAKKFKRWVTSEVLPSIRKHGAYMTEDTIKKVITEPDFIIQLATELKKEKEQNKQLTETCSQQQQVIGELKPKADYVDRILNSKSLVPITAIAKDYGMSGRKMNATLHQLGVIYKMGRQWLLYSQHQSCGYTASETVEITRSNGMPDVVLNTKWTQKGRLFLYNLLKGKGILPAIER